MRGFSYGVLFGVFISFSMACTSMLPMTGDLKSTIPELEIKRVASITHLTEDQVRDPTIHEVHEIKLSFWQMQAECYPSVKWWMKLLGSFPMACTKIIQQPWNEKVALIYYWAPLAPFSLEHERRHAKGETHAWW